MDQRRLGTTGLRVSRLGLGTMTWGRDTGEDDAAAQLAAFADAGGTLIDTAASYAGGDAELIIGRLLRDGVPRSEVVLATKTSAADVPGADATGGGMEASAPRQPGGATARNPPPGAGGPGAGGLGAGGLGVAGLSAGGGASRRSLLACLDASLRRLGVDHVDLWQVDAWDPSTPLEETLSAVDDAVSAGRARYAGVCNYAGWQLARAATWQQAWPGRAPISSVQVEYSLLARDAEREVLPAAADRGVGVLCWSPLGRGVLTGKYRTGIPADSRAATPHFGPFVQPYLGDRSRAIVEAVSTAADGLGVSPLAVALSWVRDRPAVTSAIVGARTTGQLTGILQAEDVVLPAEIARALDDVSVAGAACGLAGNSAGR
ncbi:MAG TPA: aldo/keto reductase [Streptosporangiaceae bacterium]|nr:aldo/keto reductase [Streptosporangiaceae bacterium]